MHEEGYSCLVATHPLDPERQMIPRFLSLVAYTSGEALSCSSACEGSQTSELVVRKR